MLIATLSFEVHPEKRAEFVGAINHLLQSLRWTSGCFGCRLLTDCEDPNAFMLLSEWSDSAFLDQYLASPDFQILEGMRFLLREGPGLSIDEVVSRGRPRGPVRHAR